DGAGVRVGDWRVAPPRHRLGETVQNGPAVQPVRPPRSQLVVEVGAEARQPGDVDDRSARHVQQALLEHGVDPHQHRAVDAAEADAEVGDLGVAQHVTADAGDVDAGLDGPGQRHVVDDRLDKAGLETVDRLV